MSKKSSFDISGLEKLQKKFDILTKTNPIPLSELFTKTFISKYTNFSNSDEFFNACNIHTDEDLKQISDNELNNLVSKFTKFNSWQEMIDTSVSEYMKKQLT